VVVFKERIQVIEQIILHNLKLFWLHELYVALSIYGSFKEPKWE